MDKKRSLKAYKRDKTKKNINLFCGLPHFWTLERPLAAMTSILLLSRGLLLHAMT